MICIDKLLTYLCHRTHKICNSIDLSFDVDVLEDLLSEVTKVSWGKLRASKEMVGYWGQWKVHSSFGMFFVLPVKHNKHNIFRNPNIKYLTCYVLKEAYLDKILFFFFNNC